MSALADAVRMEALAAGRRRALARQTGATSHGGMPRGSDSHLYNWADRIRQLADEMDEEETADRRARHLAKLSTPSDLIARAKADWPNQVEAVQAYATANGLGLGEAWRETIAAGVAALRNGEGD